MIYNTDVNSIYEVFSTENPRYVSLALDAFNKDSRTIAILKKRYGSNFDGVGCVRFLSYAEDQYLELALTRLHSYIKTIKVLAEVYKETDAQILKRFRMQSDEKILNMIRNINVGKPDELNNLLTNKSAVLAQFGITERLLIAALEHVENFDHKRIYMYYYGIARTKMDTKTIIGLFPDYTETKVREVLLKVQGDLPKYIELEREKEKEKINTESTVKKRKYNKSSIPKNTPPKSGFRYNSLFDYFFDKDDTIAIKREKHDIVLDYMEQVDPEEDQVIKKIFGDSYNELVPNVELSEHEKKVFRDLRQKIKKYIDHILSIRHENKGRVSAADRAILALNNGFKEKLNDYFEKKRYPLAMDIFNHYLSTNEETKNYFSKFYDLDTMNLKTNVYSSKNDVKTLKAKVKEINDYIKACSSISNTFKEKLVNYFKKPLMSDARLQLVYELSLKGIETLSEKERLLLQSLYGEDYKTLNIYADITSDDFEIIKNAIKSVGNYVSHSLEMINTYKATIFTYFHKSGMSVNHKAKLDAEIKRFIDESSSKGKYVAVMLYGASYSKLDPSVTLSEEQVRLFNLLLDEIKNHLELVKKDLNKMRKSRECKNRSLFLNYFIDPNASDEENNIMIEEVKKTIDNDNSKHKSLFLKFYGEDYILKSNLEMTKNDKMNIRYFRKKIYSEVFGDELPKSIYDMVSNGRTNGKRKARIIEETDKFIEGISDNVKVILRKVYGTDFHSFNSEVKLSNYELYIITKFKHELNAYIIESVPFIKTKRQESEDYVKTKKGRLPKKFFSFLSDVETDMSLEELTKDAKAFVNNSTSKNVLAAKKLYGEELLELDESIVSSAEEVKSVQFLIRDIKVRYKKLYDGYSLKNIHTILNLKEEFLDNFNISYDETNKNMVINRINYNISNRDSVFSRILHEIYGEDLTEYNPKEIQISVRNLTLFKSSLKVINNLFEKNMMDYNLKDDFLEYIYTDTSNREQLVRDLSNQIDAMDTPHGVRFKRLIKFIYDDNYKLVRPMQLRDYEVTSFEKSIRALNLNCNNGKKIKRPYSKKSMKTYFFDNFLFEGETVVPESRKNMIVKIVRGSKSSISKLAIDLFGTNLDQECRDFELLENNKYDINRLIKRITQRLTNTYSKRLFMLADNFIEQFYLETDTPKIKKSIKEYVINYISVSHSKQLRIVKDAYDKNYDLRKDYLFDGNKRSYSSFVRAVFDSTNSYRKKLISGKLKKVKTKDKKKTTRVRQPKTDMMDLGKNGYLALTNDLFDIKLIGNEELLPIEYELTDDVINSAYNELKDSQTIMDLLMISSDTLVNFYLNHLDDLEDPTEAFNYLINLGDKDIIKRLMVSPLFLRVVNYLTDKEREVIYLKLVQISNSSLTDETIAKIAKVDIDTIRKYEIMTKEEKVNDLNRFIIKHK